MNTEIRIALGGVSRFSELSDIYSVNYSESWRLYHLLQTQRIPNPPWNQYPLRQKHGLQPLNAYFHWKSFLGAVALWRRYREDQFCNKRVLNLNSVVRSDDSKARNDYQ